MVAHTPIITAARRLMSLRPAWPSQRVQRQPWFTVKFCLQKVKSIHRIELEKDSLYIKNKTKYCKHRAAHNYYTIKDVLLSSFPIFIINLWYCKQRNHPPKCFQLVLFSFKQFYQLLSTKSQTWENIQQWDCQRYWLL